MTNERFLRVHITIEGAVQGVGFRPFIYRLAHELELVGWVNNSSQGVTIEAEGAPAILEDFVQRISQEKPPLAIIDRVRHEFLPANGFTVFEIHDSETSGDKTTLVLPDVATCPDCLREIFDPTDRRYRYPFTNCTNCGPRYSIIQALPYDRPNTTMQRFQMCDVCQTEYENPLDRRFHAQPNACPDCGPHLELWNGAGETLATHDSALVQAAEAIRAGQIVAVKGLGGFHLMADARNDAAVKRLRDRKHREEKPFALMCPTLESIQAICEVSKAESRLLQSPESPIVLLRREIFAELSRLESEPMQQYPDSPSPFKERGLGGVVASPALHAPDGEAYLKRTNSPLPGDFDQSVAGWLSASGDTGNEIPDDADVQAPLSTGRRFRRGIASPALHAPDGEAHLKQTNSPLEGDFDQSVAGWLLASGDTIAPNNPYLGVMLPYTPLHHLLMAELGFPVVATSGNLSDEPICTDEHEALSRLAGIADVFLVHNRPIVRHVDDSIARVILGETQITRRARGFAPLPVRVKDSLPTMIATGAHLKNAIAASVGRQVFVSQHIGDLETVQAFDAFKHVLASFRDLYELEPAAIACDLHPDYLSTQYAEQMAADLDIPLIRVQHHYAHVLSCMAEHDLAAPVLGVSWDGTGYGTDGTIWGGEFLAVDDETFTRIAHLKTFRLPGGDQAVKEPRRTAVGLLYEIYGDDLFDRDDLAPVRAFSAQERRILASMLAKGLNAPITSSAGRLFDAIAAIVNLRQTVSFEGQAAMESEFALDKIGVDAFYNFEIHKTGHSEDSDSVRPALQNLRLALSTGKGDRGDRGRRESVLDWSPMISGILDDVRGAVPTGLILTKFHNTLVEMILAVAQDAGIESVVLTGGCFQNRYLTERTVSKLKDAGFRPFWHQRVPPNDGGIALGQIMAAARELNHKS